MIGSRISELRRRRNMTQKQLAAYLSVSLNSISLYERDLSTPDDESKVKLAKLFNVSMDYLMGTSDQEVPLRRTEGPLRILYCENLPAEAEQELSAFMKYFQEKYNL